MDFRVIKKFATHPRLVSVYTYAAHKFNLESLKDKNHRILSFMLLAIFSTPFIYLRGIAPVFCYFIFVLASFLAPYTLFPQQKFLNNWQRFFVVTSLYVLFSIVILKLGQLPFYTFFAGVIIYALTSAHNIYLLLSINTEREEKIAHVWAHRVSASMCRHFQNSVPVISGSITSDAVLLRIDVNDHYKKRDKRITELSYDVAKKTLEKDINGHIRETGGLILAQEEFTTLAAFGPRIGADDSLKEDYWQKAFACAQELQRKLVDINEKNSLKLMPIVPMALYLGDISLDIEYSSNNFTIKQPDLTQLEDKLSLYVDTSESFMLMMSKDFYHKLAVLPDNLCYNKYIQEKKSGAFIEVKEYIPAEVKSQRDEVETKFNAHLNFLRKDSRFNLDKKYKIDISSPDLDVKGQLMNFSKHGFLLNLNKCLGKYSKIKFFFACEEEKFKANLPESVKRGVEVEIRYELYSNPEKFIHGVKILGNSADEGSPIFKTLLLFKA